MACRAVKCSKARYDNNVRFGRRQRWWWFLFYSFEQLNVVELWDIVCMTAASSNQKKKKNEKISSSAATKTGRNNISDNSRWRSHTAYHMPHIIINNRRECRVISLFLDSFMHQNNVHSHCECDNRPKRCTPQWPNQASQITFIICSS